MPFFHSLVDDVNQGTHSDRESKKLLIAFTFIMEHCHVLVFCDVC